MSALCLRLNPCPVSAVKKWDLWAHLVWPLRPTVHFDPVLWGSKVIVLGEGVGYCLCQLLSVSWGVDLQGLCHSLVMPGQ